MIAIVDYGAGNLTSVVKAFRAAGADPVIAREPSVVTAAGAVVVPGVGHFGATRALDETWREAVLEVIGSGRPILGVCLGMQWLFEGSEEAPDCAGLGLISGTCERLPDRAVKIPHVGWNSLEIVRPKSLLEGVADGAQVYFTHSYAAPITEEATATTEYGQRFASVVERGQVFGVQFHPEKSGEIGLQILRNFLSVV